MRPLELIQRQLEGVLRRVDRAHREGEITGEERDRIRPHVLQAIEAARQDRPIHATPDTPPAGGVETQTSRQVPWWLAGLGRGGS